MYQGSNKTALASQTQIADALIGLMAETPYTQISICQICREAEVSRQTFYSLFDSKDQVILYELEKKYCLNLDGRCCHSASLALSLTDIARVYSRYIHENGPFLKLLVENGIIDCMTDSLYHSFVECEHFMPELSESTRSYAAYFLAGGLTGVAQCYVLTCEKADISELEHMIYSLFHGELFTP